MATIMRRVPPVTGGEPADRLALQNWATAGRLAEGGIPARLTIATTFAAATYGSGTGDAYADIQAALNACPSGQTVLLGPGVFWSSDYLKIPSNVTLRGSGAGVTTLRNNNGGVRADTDLGLASGNSLGLVQIGASAFPHWLNTGLLTLTADAVQGAYSCTVNSVAGLSVGQYVLVSEDQFFTGGNWTTKPLSGGVANRYEKWKTDKITWARDRLLGTPVTILSSDAGTDRFTLNRSDLVFPAGGLTYLTGHSGSLSPADPDGYYRILDQPTANTVRLQTQAWSSTLVDVTGAGTGGTLTVNPPGEYQAAGGTIPPDSGWLTWHSRGYGHVYGETKRITGIVGLTVSFESPFTSTYRVSQLAQIAVNDTTFVEHAGLENMTLHRGSNGAVRFLAAAKCWIYNCDIYEWIGHGIHVEKSYRVHVEGCTVRYATWRQPGGGSYAIALYDQTSDSLVQNCVLVDSNKNIAVNAAGAGCVLGYSYLDDTLIYSDLTWQETGCNASHFGGSHHMLIEGNYAPNGDSDNTHGSSHAITYHRNWFSGQRASWTDAKNVRCFGLGYGSLDMSMTGCVLGRSGAMSGWQNAPSSFTDPTVPAVYKFGYDPGDWNQAYDPAVAASFYEGNNWNWLTGAIQLVETTTPDSRYLSARPAWFGSQTWPWVTPLGATKTERLPAKYRYEQGDWNNLALTGPGGAGSPTFVASKANEGSDAAPTLTYAATAGRTLFLWVTTTGTTTITGPSGWTAHGQLAIFSNYRAQLFSKIATGSDSYLCSLSSSEAWTTCVLEFSGMPATITLRSSAQQQQNSTTPESGNTSASVIGDLVLSGLADSSGTIGAPSGYTGVVPPAPYGVLHYGTAFLMMGALAYKVSAAAAVENAVWSHPAAFSGIGCYVFSGS